jgi:general secretion pathway protein I
MRKHGTQQRGFSLIEVVIALAVLAIALSALIDSSSSATANTIYLRDKTLAHWVAMNKMAEIKLAGSWPDVGIKTTKSKLSDREWSVETTVNGTPEPSIRRIDIRIRKPGDPKETSVTLLTGFIHQGPKQ